MVPSGARRWTATPAASTRSRSSSSVIPRHVCSATVPLSGRASVLQGHCRRRVAMEALLDGTGDQGEPYEQFRSLSLEEEGPLAFGAHAHPARPPLVQHPGVWSRNLDSWGFAVSVSSRDRLAATFPTPDPTVKEAILDTVPAGVYFTDAGGAIVAFNRTAAALWGRRP